VYIHNVVIISIVCAFSNTLNKQSRLLGKFYCEIKSMRVTSACAFSVGVAALGEVALSHFANKQTDIVV